MYLPTSLEPATTRPVTAVAESAGLRDQRQQQPSAFVYRGEWLESAARPEYRPQYNLQISPENRRAIATYQKVSGEPPLVGKILDGFI